MPFTLFSTSLICSLETAWRNGFSLIVDHTPEKEDGNKLGFLQKEMANSEAHIFSLRCKILHYSYGISFIQYSSFLFLVFSIMSLPTFRTSLVNYTILFHKRDSSCCI